MKPSTMKRKANRMLMELNELSNLIKENLSKEDGKTMIRVINRYEHFRELLETLPFDTLTATGKKPKTNRNGLDRQVFEKYCYTCAVCGLRDLTLKNISCVRLCKDPKGPEQKICLCTKHTRELKRMVPWDQRDDEGKLALAALRKIESDYMEEDSDLE